LSTSKIKLMNPPGLFDPSAFGFSHVAVAPPGATLVFIAGQSGGDENGNYSSDFSDQLNKSFAHLRIALAAAGALPEDVVKITILSVDHDDEKLTLIAQAAEKMWGERKPTSTLIPVLRLAGKNMLFEIDAIAVIQNH